MFIVKGESCNGRKMSKRCLIVLLDCNSDGSKKLIPLVIDLVDKRPRYLKNIKNFPTCYKANRKYCIAEVIFQDYLQQLDKKVQFKDH